MTPALPSPETSAFAAVENGIGAGPIASEASAQHEDEGEERRHEPARAAGLLLDAFHRHSEAPGPVSLTFCLAA